MTCCLLLSRKGLGRKDFKYFRIYSCWKQSKWNEVAEFNGPDLHQECLKSQLSVLHSHESPNNLQSVVSHLKSMNIVERVFYSDVIKVVKLFLVMPATNALSERSFSCLRRIKTWLRSTCGQVRLYSCMTLHVHKTRTDSMSMSRIANEFNERNNSRVHIFGRFT